MELIHLPAAAAQWQSVEPCGSANGVTEPGANANAAPSHLVTPARVQRVAMIVVGLALLVGVARIAGSGVPRFTAWVAEQGAWAPLAYIGGYVLLTIAFVPGALPTMAAGALFGLGAGTVYAFVGEVLGGAAAFWFARSIARPLVEPRLRRSARFVLLDRAVAGGGRRIVFLLRLSPAIPFNALNYALGVSTIRFVDYVVASVAMLPACALYVYYGKLIGDVAAVAGGAAPAHDRTYWIATALGVGVTLVVSGVLARIATRALRAASVEPPDAPLLASEPS